MNLAIADLEMNHVMDRSAMIALTGGSITIISPWSNYGAARTSYGNYRNGSYFNLKKSVFGWTVIYGKKRYEFRTKTTVQRQRRSRSILG